MDAFSSGCIARYMNRVVFEVIHSSKNPTILCCVVSHYYGNTVVPEHLKALRSMHEALLQYVSYWLPGSMQDKTAHSKVFDCVFDFTPCLFCHGEEAFHPILLRSK